MFFLSVQLQEQGNMFSPDSYYQFSMFSKVAHGDIRASHITSVVYFIIIFYW